MWGAGTPLVPRCSQSKPLWSLLLQRYIQYWQNVVQNLMQGASDVGRENVHQEIGDLWIKKVHKHKLYTMRYDMCVWAWIIIIINRICHTYTFLPHCGHFGTLLMLWHAQARKPFDMHIQSNKQTLQGDTLAFMNQLSNSLPVHVQ